MLRAERYSPSRAERLNGRFLAPARILRDSARLDLFSKPRDTKHCKQALPGRRYLTVRQKLSSGVARRKTLRRLLCVPKPHTSRRNSRMSARIRSGWVITLAMHEPRAMAQMISLTSRLNSPRVNVRVTSALASKPGTSDFEIAWRPARYASMTRSERGTAWHVRQCPPSRSAQSTK